MKVLSVSEKCSTYAREVTDTLKAASIRVELDDSNESLGKKIRAGKTEKVPYLLVVGDKEAEARTVSVEGRDKGKQEAASVGDFIAQITDEITRRSR